MASTKTLNAKNLETLGAERLAALLIEVSTGSAAIKRRLRLALAGDASPTDAAREIAKRLATIARSRSMIEWHRVKPLVADLDAQRRATLDLVAPRDPAAALDLLWQLTACGEPIFARTDDGSGRLGEFFRSAVEDLGPAALAARADPHALADRAFEAVRDDGYGVYDRLVATLAPALGQTGLARLRDRTLAWRAEPVATPPDADREVIGWSMNGPLYADARDARQRERTATRLLQDVADATGDVDAWIAHHEAASRSIPTIAAGIAERLLAAGRTDAAWDAIEAGEFPPHAWVPPEWERVRLAVLGALGRGNDAQAFRWERFAATLDADHLRAHLKRLPDFDDFDAERRALAHAAAFPDVHHALPFLIAWPAPERAAQMIVARVDAIDGDRYDILTPAADALEAKYPLAATILLRAMIDFALTKARSSRYGHAARHLATCAHLARRVEDWGDLPDHDAYVAGLRTTHGRKPGFWNAVDGDG